MANLATVAAKFKAPPEMIKEVHDLFQKYDEDKSGSLGPEEMGAVLSMFGRSKSDQMAKSLIDAFDEDKSGCIDFEEFAAMVVPHFKAKQKKCIVEQVASTLASTQGAIITAEDLKSAWDKTGDSLTLAEAKSLIIQADMDGDGKVTPQEFNNMLKTL